MCMYMYMRLKYTCMYVCMYVCMYACITIAALYAELERKHLDPKIVCVCNLLEEYQFKTWNDSERIDGK